MLFDQTTYYKHTISCEKQPVTICYNIDHMITLIVAYKLFLVPIIVLACAQGLKFARFTLKHGLNWDYAFAPGHFPSAHSAFVTSLVVIIGYYDDVTGPAFAVATAFAVITIYDAMRVRINIGLQGKMINKLVAELDEIENKEDYPKLKERVGHYANEVAGGIGVGIMVTFALIYLIEAILQ